MLKRDAITISGHECSMNICVYICVCVVGGRGEFLKSGAFSAVDGYWGAVLSFVTRELGPQLEYTYNG